MKKAIFKSGNKGFTLIELLVVIAIIGLLSSVVMASLNSARTKARDAYRIQSLQEIAKALAYYYDAVGHYPVANGGNWAWACDYAGNWIDDAGDFTWSDPYISSQAHEPNPICPPGPNFFSAGDTSPSVDFVYYGGAGPVGFPEGSFYVLATRLENASDRNTVKNARTMTVDGKTFYTFGVPPPDSLGWNERNYALVGQ
jgi:prepilin-type N-terminal cleavage/methylation domain-containing protein